LLELSGGTAILHDRPGWIGQENPQVHEGYNAFLIGIFFILLISSWIIANALIDLAAKRVRVWVAHRWINFDRRRASTADHDRTTIS
jgi:hypothetical protein